MFLQAFNHFQDFTILTQEEKQGIVQLIETAHQFDRDGNPRVGLPDIGAYELANPGGRSGLVAVTWEPGGDKKLADLIEVRDAIAEEIGVDLGGYVLHDMAVSRMRVVE